MCGINLFISWDKKSDADAIRSMNQAIKHRGPDAQKHTDLSFDQYSVYLGNTRLKVIDTSDNANQPFQSEDGKFHLSYNGELYNYKALRSKLSSKYPFKTNSDTEVLFYHLIENGIEGINELNGMFSFIFINQNTNDIIMARDAQGIKPLYYSSNETHFIASSEIKGVLASGKIPKLLNANQIPHYLNYKYAKKPETFYKKIYELEPGHYLELKDKKPSIKKWAMEISTTKSKFDSKAIVNDTEALLYKSVERNLQSDVPTGIFLSGGIDSTLLLSIAKNEFNQTLPSFTIANSKADSKHGTEDYHYAKKAALQYGSEYNELEIDSSILEKTKALCQSIDQPIGDSALLLTSMLSEFSSKQIKVALTGAGADEWFGGYNRHHAFQFYLNHIHQHPLRLKCIKSIGNLFPQDLNNSFRKKNRLLNKFASDIHENPETTYNRFRSVGFSEEAENATTTSFTLKHALIKDREEYLVSDILMLTDKLSMQHSLEARVPFLDKDLIDYLRTIPAKHLLQNGSKWILKSILEKHKGSPFTNRSKEGFGMPIGKWLKEDKHQNLIQGLLNKDQLLYKHIDYTKITQQIEEHLSNKKDNGTLLWSLIVLSTWLEIEFA